MTIQKGQRKTLKYSEIGKEVHEFPSPSTTSRFKLFELDIPCGVVTCQKSNNRSKEGRVGLVAGV